MLTVIEDEKAAHREIAEAWERKKSSLSERTKKSTVSDL